METAYTEKAFPCLEEVETMKDAMPHTAIVHHTGMTLLDYMAAKAMQGYVANPDNTTEFRRMGVSNETEYAMIAKASYAQAAAMLEERKKYIQ